MRELVANKDSLRARKGFVHTYTYMPKILAALGLTPIKETEDDKKLETFAKPLRTNGASNLVYKFRKDELRELGSIELMLEESVLRLTNEETPCYNDMAIRELALTLLAAKHRFGLNLHCGALLLSNLAKIVKAAS